MREEEHNLKLNKVAIYPRISSLKQLKGESLEAQEETLKSWCEVRNIEIYKVYKESGKSASIKDDKIKIDHKGDNLNISFNLNVRPAFKEMLEDAKKGNFNAIIFFRWDRFSRSVIFSKLSQIYLARLGIELIPIADDRDPLVVGIKNEISEEEVRKIKQRVNLVQQHKFNQGIMVSKQPFGYRFIYKNPKEKKGVIKIVVNKREAEIVKSIFLRTADKENYKTICDDYKLKPQVYYNIIKNKVYIGLIEFNNETKKGIHEAIISEELFNQCQK